MSGAGAGPQSRIEGRVLRSIPEVESIRDTWVDLGPKQMPADIDYFLTVVDSSPGVERPHVILLEDAGSPVGLVAGRLERRRIREAARGPEVNEAKTRAITVVYGGIVSDEAEIVEAGFRELRAALADGEADVVLLNNLRVGSALHGLATSRPGLLTRQRGGIVVDRMALEIPDSFPELLSSLSAKSRENIRREERRIVKEFGDEVSIRVFTDPGELDELRAALEQIARVSRQHGSGAMVLGEDEFRRRLSTLTAERGWLRAYVLFLGGQPAAYWLGFVYGGVWEGYRGSTGYDPAFSRLSPGRYLLMRLLSDLCSDEAVHRFDFGFGASDYKRRFAPTGWSEEDVFVFAPTPRGVALNLRRTVETGSLRLAKRIRARRAAQPEGRSPAAA